MFHHRLRILKSVTAALALLALAVPAAASGSAPSLTPVQAHGKLTVKDLKLIDAHGVPVQLRGFSSYDIGSSDWLFTPEFVKELIDAKVDILRLSMYTDPYRAGYILKDGTPNLKLRDTVEDIIRVTGDAGMYCIVDWHTLRDGNPMAYVDQASDFFAYMAQKYGSDPHVLLELANEPNGPGITWDDVCRPYATAVLAAIRKVSTDAVCIVGTPTWDQDVDLAARNPLPADPNLLYAFHFYAGTHGADLRAKIAEAAKVIPLFCTEWGTTSSDADGPIHPVETAAWHDFLDQYGFSSCNWSLSTFREGSAALDHDYFPGDTTFLQALTPSGKLALQMIQRPKK